MSEFNQASKVLEAEQHGMYARLEAIQELMQKAVDQIEYKDWQFMICLPKQTLYLQVRFKAQDHNRPEEWDWHKGRKWQLSEHMTRSELIQTALKAVLTAEEHEAREQFTYRGQAIFGPHFDVEELVGLAIGKSRDLRHEYIH